MKTTLMWEGISWTKVRTKAILGNHQLSALSVVWSRSWMPLATTFHTYHVFYRWSLCTTLTVKTTSKQFHIQNEQCTIQNDTNCTRSTSMCLIKTKQSDKGQWLTVPHEWHKFTSLSNSESFLNNGTLQTNKHAPWVLFL